MTRTLRGVWSRRWTLLPLLLLTVVVVGGTVAVVAFADAAGTSRLLSLPVLLLGLVAIPGAARELAVARRGEVALARLRGLRTGALVTLLTVEPLVVLAVGGVLGLGAGLVAARIAADAWADDAGSLGWQAPVAGLVIVVAALVAVVAGSAATLRESLADQVRAASRPRAASVLATFGGVLIVVAAVVAVYRSRVADGAPDAVVLAGPALVGLACGEAVVWLLRLGARALVPLTSGRGLGGFLASRRVARVADAVTSVRVLVAAAVVAGLALTGAEQVRTWTDDTARLQAGAPLQIPLDTDAGDAISLTHRLDPDGRYLMAAVLVPGTGAVPKRRAFLDTARYRRVVGDFYAGTPAAAVGDDIDRLGGSDSGLARGSTVTATVSGVPGQPGGPVRLRVVVAYRDEDGRSRQVQVRSSVNRAGGSRTSTAPLASCSGGCVVTGVSLIRDFGDFDRPWLLSDLQVGDLDVLGRTFASNTPNFAGAPPAGPAVVDHGLVFAVDRSQSASQTIAVPPDPGDRAPILATDTARWSDGPPELDSPGGDQRRATVLQRYAGLPLVQRDGVLADLPRATTGAPPTVPAAQVLVLARADTPASVLAGLRTDQDGPVRSLADIREQTFQETRSAQSAIYALMAVCCLLVALLVLATAVGRQRRAWLRDLAALRVVGVDRARLRGAGRREVLGLVLAAALGTAAGTVLAVRLLLGDLPLVDVPEHAVPLRSGVEAAPLVLAVVLAGVVVAAVAGRGRRTTPAASRPAILRDEA